MSRRLLSSLFWVNVGAGAVLCALVWVSAPTVAGFFRAPAVSPVMRALSLSLLLASCGVVHNAILTREMRFKAIAVTDLASAFTAYVVALVSAIEGAGVWALVFASLAGSFTSTLGYVLAAWFRPRAEFDWPEVKSIAKFSSNLSAFGIVNYGYRNADNLIVGRVLGSVPLGYYQMAYNLMLTPLSNVSSVIAQVLFPAFARIQDEDERFRDAFVRACMLTALLTFPIMAGLGTVADPLIRAVLGSKWAGAIVPFQILSVVGLVQSVNTMVGIIYQAKARTDIMFRWSLVILISTVAAFLIGVHFGIVGVAAAYAIVFIGGLMVPGFAIPLSLIGLRFATLARALFPQLMLTLAMVAVCIAWEAGLRGIGQKNAWLELVSTSVIGAAVYIGGLVTMRLKVLSSVEAVLSASNDKLARTGLGWLKRLRIVSSSPAQV